MVRLGLLYWPTPTIGHNVVANNSIDPSLRELITELDGFPLVLSDSGAYFRKFPITCADYLKIYRASWLRLQTSIPRHLEDKGLHSALDSLFPRIELQNVNSARLLELWAYFDSADLWFELLAEGRSAGPPWFQEITADAPSFYEAVGVLRDYGLAESSVEQTPGLHGYSLHKYVHSWAVHVLNDTKSKISAKLAMRCVSQHVAGDIEAAGGEGGRRLLPHAERCWDMFVDGLLADEKDPSIFFTSASSWVKICQKWTSPLRCTNRHASFMTLGKEKIALNIISGSPTPIWRGVTKFNVGMMKLWPRTYGEFLSSNDSTARSTSKQ